MLKLSNATSIKTFAFDIWLQFTGIPSQGSDVPQRPNPIKAASDFIVAFIFPTSSAIVGVSEASKFFARI